MSTLSLYGLFAVMAMLVTYALEQRSHWFVLAFAFSCLLGSDSYGFFAGRVPFGLVGSRLGTSVLPSAALVASDASKSLAVDGSTMSAIGAKRTFFDVGASRLFRGWPNSPLSDWRIKLVPEG